MGKRKEVDIDYDAPVGGDVVIISGEKYPISPDLLRIKDQYDHMTERQRKWFDAYLVNRDQSRSAEIAGYAGKSGTLRSMGHANYDKFKDMIAVIDEVAKGLIQAVTELTGIYSFWGETLVNKDLAMRDRLKASELLARALGAFDGEGDNINININTDKTDELPSEVLEAFIIAETKKLNEPDRYATEADRAR